MAHDGFLGGSHDLPWPLSHHAVVANATGGGPFDALQVHVQHALMGAGAVAGWEHDAVLGSMCRRCRRHRRRHSRPAPEVELLLRPP